jgi:hypothetical protein
VRVAYLKGDEADQDATDEKDERDDEPDDTPHLCFLKFVKKGCQRSARTRSNKALLGLPCEGKQPQIFAKADASEAFTFRAMVSSAGRKTTQIVRLLPHCLL